LLAVMASGFVFLPDMMELAQERSSPGPGAKSWDIPFVVLFFACYLAMPIVAGLDVGRFHWTGPMPWGAYCAGYLGYAAGSAIFLWAMRVNRFFSSVVRIQTERGHHVIDTGPYALVRHPGYVGAILFVPGMALILGSLWALVPAGVMLAGLIARTKLEDSTLQNELPGYKEYSARVRYRILPGIW
jgi:protein-S-isoprenylcysteine O-methyltransferase Ste14